MNPQDERQPTKNLLLSATEELVREKGCRKMTLNNIMERTGLSKGAIYHYVRSKDELLALVLKESFADINDRFFGQIEKGNKSFEGPLGEITQSLPPLQDSYNPANQIFIYLLGESDDPDIREVVQQFYDQTIELSKQWIISGQKYGVIPLSVDADKTAELFLLLASGFRMRSAVSTDSYSFTADDLSSFITKTLNPTKE